MIKSSGVINRTPASIDLFDLAPQDCSILKDIFGQYNIKLAEHLTLFEAHRDDAGFPGRFLDVRKGRIKTVPRSLG